MSNQSDENQPMLGNIVFGPNNNNSQTPRQDQVDAKIKSIIQQAESLQDKELNKLVKPLQDKLDIALRILKSLQEKGTLHDLRPDGTTHRNCGHFTLLGFGGNKSGFHEYIKSMDDYVKEYAKLALEEIENY